MHVQGNVIANQSWKSSASTRQQDRGQPADMYLWERIAACNALRRQSPKGLVKKA